MKINGFKGGDISRKQERARHRESPPKINLLPKIWCQITQHFLCYNRLPTNIIFLPYNVYSIYN